jgi:hypothetical protein
MNMAGRRTLLPDEPRTEDHPPLGANDDFVPPTLPVLTCRRERCGHQWVPRTGSPKQCPRCHQNWRVPLVDMRQPWSDERRARHKKAKHD